VFADQSAQHKHKLQSDSLHVPQHSEVKYCVIDYADCSFWKNTANSFYNFPEVFTRQLDRLPLP